jgi:hypothetical protein
MMEVPASVVHNPCPCQMAERADNFPVRSRVIRQVRGLVSLNQKVAE